MKRLGFLFFFVTVFFANAQESQRVSISQDLDSFSEIVDALEEQTNYQFFYKNEWVDTLSYSLSVTDRPLEEVMDLLLEGKQLYYYQLQDQIFITYKVRVRNNPRISELLEIEEEQIQDNLQKGLVFTREYLNETPSQNQNLESRTFEIGSREQLTPGGEATVAGYVKEQSTGEPIMAALVYSQDPLVSTTTDASGFYSLKLPVGKNRVNYQLVGMKPTYRNLVLFSNGQLNVNMEDEVVALDEVVIESNRDANVQNVQMGVSRISVTETKNVPIVLGERDVMKVATTLAGVQSVGEGASGFNVRGGKSDQNLITLDGAPIYNTSHFFGFFSVFNSEAIDDLQIYKSSIPARYGGRLSSVMDIKSKKANRDSISGSGGVSAITSKLTLEAPLFNGKAGITASGRTTYSNWILKRVGNSEFNQNRVSFADGLLRYDHNINENNYYSLSGYYSVDNFRMNSDTLFSFSNFKYENIGGSFKFVHQFSPDISASLSAIYSRYQYELSFDTTPESAFLQDFDIDERSVKAEINHTKFSDHEITGGFEGKSVFVNPGTQKPFGEESIVRDFQTEQEQGVESAVFISDQYSMMENLSFYVGLRYSMFHALGSQTVNEYLEDAPKNDETKVDSTVYGEGELIKAYHGFEPRVSARYSLDRRSSIKAGYNRTRQYVHTLTNSASVSPTDIWRLSSAHLSPQVADQFSVGYYRNIPRFNIESSVEVYYKKIDNLLDFKVGSRFLLNPDIETVTLQGPGKSYGFEFSLEKSGRLSGWLNYTYARTFIRLDSDYGEERINGGIYYPANYDIPHTVNLVANYELTHRISVSYNFSYKTGRPVTYPSGIYDFHNSLSVHYSDRNEFRIPDYLRMDLGINLEAGHRKNKLAYSYWSFSVYNLLGRSNPYSVFFSIDDGEIRGYKLVVFGTPIPTISYNFKF